MVVKQNAPLPGLRFSNTDWLQMVVKQRTASLGDSSSLIGCS